MKRAVSRPLLIISAEPEVIDLLQSMPGVRFAGVVDKDPRADCSGLAYRGDDAAGAALLKKNPSWRVVLALDPPPLKRTLAGLYGLSRLATVRSESSYVAATARVGAGSILQWGVKVFPRAVIGVACKINSDAAVHHDCVVGDFCTLAPGARLLGTVTVADEVYVGAGAIVLPHVRIGRGAVIGAGAVVVDDVEPQTVVVGVPARPLKGKSR